MLNHFRTLLLNLPYNGPGEFIPSEFGGKSLPQDLQQIYNLLFPGNVTRHYKLFLAHTYLNVIDGVGMTNATLKFDNRTNYKLKAQDFFKIDRVSTVTSSDPGFTLEVTKTFDTVKYNDFVFDHYTVSQVDNDAVVTVYSNIKHKYLNGTAMYDTPEVAAYITLTRDSSNSALLSYNDVDIGTTGARFKISEPSTGEMLDNSGLRWDFVIEGPYSFDITEIINHIEQINPFTVLNKYDSDISYYNSIYSSHFNPLYRFSAFLIAYVTVINNL